MPSQRRAYAGAEATRRLRCTAIRWAQRSFVCTNWPSSRRSGEAHSRSRALQLAHRRRAATAPEARKPQLPRPQNKRVSAGVQKSLATGVGEMF
jgi:hypothetical protein